jgi:hypothetical protein
MSEFDDRTLLRVSDSDPVPDVSPPRTASRGILIVIAAGLLLGAVAAWWWARAPASVPANPAVATGTEGVVAPTRDPSRPLPPLNQMDTFLRALLGGLSSSPELARWLATDDLIRQMANAIDRISRGFSPARDLGVLKPRGTFAMQGPREQLTIDPASYRRYDPLAAIVASADAQSVADAYRTIQPRLDEAYRALGRTEASVDDAISVALQVLIETPVVRGPVRVTNGPGATFAFADPELEKLRPVQKQLLRMGPENVARIRERLKEIKQAIDAPATVKSGA